jgi:hypothetical protein
MPRTVPVSSTQAPGNLITSALWNAGPAASNAFLTGPPLAQITQTSTQTVLNNTPTVLQFDTTGLDTDSGHSNIVNNSRYTCQVVGWYLVIGGVGWAPNSTGNRLTLLYKNGVQVSFGSESFTATSANSCVVQASWMVQMAVGDYVEIYGYQGSGGNLATQGGFSSAQFIWVHS